jgi:hypothetical protein
MQTTPSDEMPDDIPAFETRSSREGEDRKRTDLYNARQSAVDRYSTALSSLLRGNSPNVPPALFGETLEQEVTACLLYRKKHAGAVGDGMDDVSVTSYMRNARIVTDNAHQKLYGGAQYHRTMHHFHEALLATPLPDISTDEINLLIDGRSQTHDGSDLLRTVALLARHKIEGLVIQLLDELTCRVQYVLERLWDVVSYNLTTRPVRGTDSTTSRLLDEMEDEAMTEKVTQAYKEFVAWRARVAREKCVADVYALIRFVSWDLQYRRPSNPASGPIDGNAMARSPETVRGGHMHGEDDDDDDGYLNDDGDMGDLVGGVLNPGENPDDQRLTTAIAVGAQNHLSAVGNAQTIEDAIRLLVETVTHSWRREMSRLIMGKFNVYFFLSFHEDFGQFLRQYLAKGPDVEFDLSRKGSSVR